MIDRHAAASIAEAALRAVYDPEVVAGLREDSPLTVVALQPGDLVCLADAAVAAADERGLRLRIGDADLAHLSTVADLIDAIAGPAGEEAGSAD